MGFTRVDYISCCAHTSRNNAVQINICLDAYEAIGSPKELIFDETLLRIKVPSINAKNSYLLNVNKRQAQITVSLFHTPADTLIGHWSYEVDDLSIFLTDKIQ